jgi:hypothetical protein
MTKTAALKHTHQYYFLDGLWHCSNCSHYLPKNVANSIRTKTTICWACEKEFSFKLDPDALDMKKPECTECRGKLNDISAYLKEKGLA